MGWKAVRDHYRIEHIVQVTDKGICIGSGYIHDCIVIDKNRGEVITRYDPSPGWSRNADLLRYQAEMDADPFKLAELVAAPDRFERSITVFTYAGGEILEKQCEELGWPNVTHNGLIQYENMFSTDRGLVRSWAIDNARAGVEWRREQVAQAKVDLEELEKQLAQREADLRQLEAGSAPQ